LRAHGGRTYREEEVEPELEDGLLEPVAGPHHLEVVLGHVVLLGAEVAAVRPEEVAVAVHRPASLVRGGVDGHDEEVVQQRRRALAETEALEEEVQEGARRRVRLVDGRHDDRLVLHRRVLQ
jgi:hypothetical protein